MIEPAEFEPNQEFENKVRSAIQVQDPDQIFIERLQKKLTERFKDLEQSIESGSSKWQDKFKIALSPLAWGAIALIIILSLVWGIKNLIPRSEPGISSQPSPSPLMQPTQAEGGEGMINLPTDAGMPVPWPEEAITSENAPQVTLLARWGLGMITGVTWSPDGSSFAIASTSGIHLFNAANFVGINTSLSGSNVYNIAYSPDGTMLAGGINESSVKIWDVKSGNELHTLDGYKNFITKVAFLPGGDILVTLAYEEPIKLWDVASGRELRTLGGSDVADFDISPDGTMLASASGPGYRAIKVWDIASGEELRTLTGHTDSVFRLDFSLDGNTLASASDDNTIKLWDVVKGTELSSITVGTNPVSMIAFSPKGDILASVDFGGRLQLWDITSGQEIPTQYGDLQVGYIDFSPDGKVILASVNTDNSIKLLDVTSGIELRSFDWQSNIVSSVAVSPDGNMIASGSYFGLITLLNSANGQVIRTLVGHTDQVANLDFSPESDMLASASWDTIKLWDVANGNEMLTLAGQSMEGYASGVPCVAFSPDGKILAYGAEAGQVMLWDIANNQLLHALGGQPDGGIADEVNGVAFSPDGKILASIYSSHTWSITLWDVTNGEELRTLTKPFSPSISGGASALAFSPDGKYLAAAIGDKTITLWDVASGSELRTLLNDSEVMRVAYSRDGDVLASTSEEWPVTLWDAVSGQVLNNMAVGQLSMSSLAFSPDGKVLVSGSWDGMIRVWGIAPGTAAQSGVATESPPVEIIPTAEPTSQATPEELALEKIPIPVLLTGEDLQPGSWSLDGNYFYYNDQGRSNEAGPDQAINSLNFLDTRMGTVCPGIQETVTFTQTGWELYKRTTWLGDNRFLYISPQGDLLSINPCGDSIENLSTSLPDSIISFNSGVKPDGSQVVIKGGQAYWLFTPSTQQALRLDLPAPETGKEMRFAWSSGEEKLISSRIEDRQGDLWIIFDSIEIEKGTATPVYEVRASQQLAMQDPQVAYFELASDNEIFISDTDTGMALIDISSQPARQTDHFPDLFGIVAPSMQSITTRGTVRGTGEQDYHLILATGMAAAGQYYIYHPESGVVDQYPLDPPLLVVFPSGEGGTVPSFVDSPPSNNTLRVVLVDSDTQPYDLVVKGHSPGAYSWSFATILPGARRVLFSSVQGISLVDLQSGETLKFWGLENQEQYADFSSWLSPDGKTVVGFASLAGSGQGYRNQAMHWLRLEP